MMHIPEQFKLDIKNRFAELIPIVDEMINCLSYMIIM